MRYYTRIQEVWRRDNGLTASIVLETVSSLSAVRRRFNISNGAHVGDKAFTFRGKSMKKSSGVIGSEILILATTLNYRFTFNYVKVVI